ncbi:hypothetical protein KIW84_053303 [Lathyrus oleraceus]|uniref:Uncharacterized protein n=1 Tax=Pisum sativum TaxID=3888 RepID=A0A9D4WSD1_PEA|nr:hypothetical protein KIW84_053303 [Pisum sativum]
MREMEDKMASNQDDTHDVSGSRNNVENEIKRGLTVMKSIIRARDKGEKFEVHWSAEDQLIEPNGSMLGKKKYGPRYRDPFTSMKAGKNIVFNWPEKDS